jgi:hypothetical protein
MPVERLHVGVVVGRRPVDNPWIDHIWTPVAVLPQMPAAEAWSVLGRGAAGEDYYAGAAEIELHSVDTANLRDNLATGAPRLWIALRPTGVEPPLEIAGVTADPAEGEAFTEAGDDIVQTVPMPPEIAHAVAVFIETHHVEREFFKRQRDRATPGGRRRGPGARDEG